MSIERWGRKWDVFISYASEDKEDVARPLAHYLDGQGLRVWFDEFQLEVGNSLTEAISVGLSNSDYGLVIVSPAFMRKKWTLNELGALFALEDPSRGRILPIWHHVSEIEVATFNPALADRVALKTSAGFDNLTSALMNKFAIHSANGDGELSGYWFGKSGRLLLRPERNSIVGDYDWYGKPWAGSLRGNASSGVLRFDWSWELNDLNGSGFFLIQRSISRASVDISELVGAWWYSSTHLEVDTLVEEWPYQSLDEKVEGVNSWEFARDSWQERVLRSHRRTFA
jgi:hypothetical protein